MTTVIEHGETGADGVEEPEDVHPQGLTALDVAGSSFVILAVLMLTFVVTVTGLGTVRHARDQQTAYASFRNQLANATAVVGQLDQGRPVALGHPVAVIDLPQIGVREVVGEGTTSGVLESGPGHRRDTPMPGQAGISLIYGRKAGFGGPFAHLDQLRKGQVFSVATGQGKHTYRVIAVRRAGDVMPAAPAAGAGRLRLVTATGPAFVPEGLLYVDADQVSPVQPGGAGPITAANLPNAEKPLAGDQSAWVPILLLVQALFLVALAITWMSSRWGRAQVWLAGLPVVLALTVALSAYVAHLLPNLM